MTSNHISGEQILGELVGYETVNDPQKKIIPDPQILEYVQNLVSAWNPNIKAKIFHNQDYSSLYLAPNLEIGADILFIGHLDVVPVTRGWISDPFSLRIEGERAFGRGSKDCKGSIVSALLMYQHLCQQRFDGLSMIGFFFSTDEETGGRNGAKLFFDHAKEHGILPKFVINVDGGTRVVYKRRAGFGVSVTTPPEINTIPGEIHQIQPQTQIFGDATRHSAYFVRGVDQHAIIALSKLLHLHREWKIRDLKGTWVKGNVIPDECVATIIKPSTNGSLEIYDENLTALLRAIRGVILLEGTQLKTEIDSEFGITMNPNILSYSTSTGTQIDFDVRVFLSPNRYSLLVEAIESRLELFSLKAKVEGKRSSGYFFTPKDHTLVTTASLVLEKHSLVTEPCEQEGASDARFASKYHIPVIDLGPEGGRIHGTDEYIVLGSMIAFATIYRDIVQHLLAL